MMRPTDAGQSRVAALDEQTRRTEEPRENVPQILSRAYKAQHEPDPRGHSVWTGHRRCLRDQLVAGEAGLRLLPGRLHLPPWTSRVVFQIATSPMLLGEQRPDLGQFDAVVGMILFF